MLLDAPARYLPIEKGLYEVAPGLRPFGTDFGNGSADQNVFQIDADYSRYRANKIACREEALEKYCVHHQSTPLIDGAVARFMIERLLVEHPRLFALEGRLGQGVSALACHLSGEKLFFDERLRLLNVEGQNRGPEYESSFDALAAQVPEDLCVIRLGEDGSDWLSSIHLCSPGHWAAGDKIGRDFQAVHLPVPGIEKINRSAASFVKAMIDHGPFVRFAWGFSTDTRLNHHPVPPPGVSREEWQGRRFHSPQESKFFLRVERQVTWGFPELRAALFTIRVSYVDGDEIRLSPEWSERLRNALASMTPESRRYKGLAGSYEAVMEWLGNP